MNIIHQSRVSWEKIVSPPFHVKLLLLMKQFVKALNVEGDFFQLICKTFPGLSYDKIKIGVFDVTQMKNLGNVNVSRVC